MYIRERHQKKERKVAKKRERAKKETRKTPFLSECSGKKISSMFKMILSLFEGESSNTQTNMYIQKENNCSSSYGDCGNGNRNGAKKEL